jgi:hypothetical protein
MPDALESTVHVARRRRWRNFHETVSQSVARLVDVWNAEPGRSSFAAYNATTEALQQLVGEALAGGLEIRALGGGWSFSPVAATSGILVNTRPLNYQFRLAEGNLDERCRHAAPDLVFAQCGTSIAELNRELRKRAKSLRTSGASNGQTVAGALSTGTHGSVLREGAIQDTVVALHLVTSPDRHVWLEPASAPVLNEASVASLGADLVRDDALFNAALVSFGSFGVIHGVVLAVTDLFYLQEYRRQHAPSPAVWAAIERLDFSGLAEGGRTGRTRPHFFQAVFNPYDRDGGPYLTLMYHEAVRPLRCPSPPPTGTWRPGDSAADVVGRITDLAPTITPALASALFPQQVPDVDGVCGTWSEMFGDTSLGGRAASTAMGVPPGRVRETLDVLHDLNAERTIPGVFAVRYVRASRATLAFTRHAPHTAVVEIDGAYSRRTLALYREARERLAARGVPLTHHWGKMLPAGSAWVREAYGSAVAVWLGARRALLPDAALRGAFSNDLVRRLGLVS